ncbi:uncharacterized protein [Cicer arietinum]|uniref:Uncharacterized protein LOC105851722 n=1 Tax=Cicer arietinum TaxID=3827 RepID=A0A1S3DZA1_CICAR|nr:uncharacterized protein LOC105851722 [Cicer arietinum]
MSNLLGMKAFGEGCTIFHSAKLSISINGKALGFFNRKRGLGQEDPSSPLPFCLAEDVLSRGISKLDVDGKLHLMSGPRGFAMPSHVLYVDDVTIFCKASHKRILIFSRKLKANHLIFIVDRIKNKLSSWKGSMLSIMGKVQPINMVIHDMLLYSFCIYNCPTNILYSLDTWVWNFIWFGNIFTQKVVTVVWNHICKPVIDGGLGLRSIKAIIKAGLIKLTWDFVNSGAQWTSLLKHRTFRNSCKIKYHITSSNQYVAF